MFTVSRGCCLELPQHDCDGVEVFKRARFNGGNYRALASQFRLSERQIRKIVNGTRV